MDYPEPLIEALLEHCEDYEDADELENALSFVRKIQKEINERKRHEALQAESLQRESRVAEELAANRTLDVAQSLHIGKRKRGNDGEGPVDCGLSWSCAHPGLITISEAVSEKNGLPRATGARFYDDNDRAEGEGGEVAQSRSPW